MIFTLSLLFAAATNWLVQCNPEEVRREFEEIQPTIREVIRMRAQRQKKDSRGEVLQKRGTGSGRSRGRGSVRNSGPVQSMRGARSDGSRGRGILRNSGPSQDRRWRESTVKR